MGRRGRIELARYAAVIAECNFGAVPTVTRFRLYLCNSARCRLTLLTHSCRYMAKTESALVAIDTRDAIMVYSRHPALGMKESIMKRAVHFRPFIVAMVLGACAATTPESESESESTQAVEAAPQASTATPAPQSTPVPKDIKILKKGASIPVRSPAAFCFNIFGPCRFGTCEEPNSYYQDLTEVCCSNGICTNEYYRQCGSCDTESSGPCS